MTRTATDKLVATIIEVTDLGDRFPASALAGTIGLDVRVEQGALSAGKTVRLRGPRSEEDLEIVGIEMLRNVHDADVVRILCRKPRKLALPSGKLDGWTIAER